MGGVQIEAPSIDYGNRARAICRHGYSRRCTAIARRSRPPLADNPVVGFGRFSQSEMLAQKHCGIFTHAADQLWIGFGLEQHLATGSYISIRQYEAKSLVANHACHLTLLGTNR